jgi:cytochrome c-type biogenesis protein
MEITFLFIISAFVAGLLMFLAPCTLPLLPAYLAFISGVKESDLNNQSSAESAVKKIRLNSLAFVLGFSLIFISFGMAAGLFGTFIGPFRNILTQIGGIFIILFGLMTIGFFHFPILKSTFKISLPKTFYSGQPLSAGLIGAIFALGWTPCVGPILASILLLASTTTTVFTGGLMLAIFSLGLAIPFLLTAFLYSRANKFITKYSYISKWINIVGGIFLIFIGVLLLSDNFGLMVAFGYKFFNLLNIDFLFNYL